MRRIVIYGLFDPRAHELRYIGKTKKKLSERLKEHIRAAKRYQHSPRGRWIKGLLDEGIAPLIEVLQEVSDDEWEEAEKHHIAEAKEKGINLTNLAEGGQGHHDYVFTEEHRRKIGEAHKGNKHGLGYRHTEEHKERVSKRMKGEGNPNYGKTFSKEYKENLSKAQKGRKHSEETKQKMRESRKKFYEDPANRKKQSEAMKGNHNKRKQRQSNNS